MRTILVKPELRWMINRDFADVLRIEKEAFGKHAWTHQEFLEAAASRAVVCYVALIDGKVVGYLIRENEENRFNIINFAVDPKFRRQGVGTCLLDNVKQKLNAQRRSEIVLQVREKNLAAQLFFKNAGFLAKSVVKACYEDCDEDAYLMSYTL